MTWLQNCWNQNAFKICEVNEIGAGGAVGTDELLGKPNKLRGSVLRWTSIPSRGNTNTPSRFMLQKPG